MGTTDNPLGGQQSQWSVEDNTAKAVTRFADSLLEAPWGSVSKSELDLMIFTLLMDTDRFGNEPSDFQIAQELRITPARVRGLRFRYDQRLVKSDPLQLFEMMKPSNFSFGSPSGGGFFEVTIHRAYLREYFTSELMKKRTMIYERTPAVLTVNREEFLRIIVDVACAGEQKIDSEDFTQLFEELVASKSQASVENAFRKVPGVIQTTEAMGSLFDLLKPVFGWG